MRSSILELLTSNASISRSEMANLIGITENSIRYHLDKMKDENIIRREGADKGGKWIVVE